MKIIGFILLCISICLGALGCSTNRHATASRSSDFEITPAEVYERWNPQNALREAERDIHQEKIKIFYHGGIAAFPAGVDSDDYELIEGLPFEDAGIGCVIVDGKLRQMQSEFATLYNRRIVEHLKQRKAEPDGAGNSG